ncbi:MAG: 6-phosphogluconate dehydrogenase [Ginsengibacter sp.]
MKSFVTWTILAVLVVICGYLFYITAYTYSDGNRAGKLIKFSHKGYVFKTYEGELNLGGINASTGGVMVNNMWDFSVVDQRVADSLSKCEGKDVTIHYKEKIRTVPWRGDTKYIVDKVVEVK